MVVELHAHAAGALQTGQEDSGRDRWVFREMGKFVYECRMCVGRGEGDRDLRGGRGGEGRGSWGWGGGGDDRKWI